MGVNDMDIVEFVEKVCEFSFTDFQKEFVRIAYDAAKNDKRYEYKIAHRFDNPPLAKCYCIDCKYCYGEPTKSGFGVYCSLFGGRLIIQDNSFCYRAQPKCEENVRNV